MIYDIIEWDVENWAVALPYWEQWIKEDYPDPATNKVLCLGERNGGLSLWFALKGFQVICSDFRGPREEAKMLHKKYGVDQKITYADVNIFKIPYPDNFFCIVACKSVIGGLKLDYKDKNTRTIKNQKLAISEIHRVLKINGSFFGAENMKGSIFHYLIRKLLKGNKIGWRYLSTSELRWLFDDFSYSEMSFYGFVSTSLNGLKGITTMFNQFASYILPDFWLYIGFIRARK